MDLYKRKIEIEEAKRKNKIKQRALETLAGSKFPPRIQKIIEDRQHRSQKAVRTEFSFQPKLRRTKMDYDREYRIFQERLGWVKRNKVTTEVQRFSFDKPLGRQQSLAITTQL